jgi:hypothetical protein
MIYAALCLQLFLAALAEKAQEPGPEGAAKKSEFQVKSAKNVPQGLKPY